MGDVGRNIRFMPHQRLCGTSLSCYLVQIGQIIEHTSINAGNMYKCLKYKSTSAFRAKELEG